MTKHSSIVDINLNPATSRRRAGVLLHPTSLPGPRAQGEIGEHAFRFIDFLAESGFTVWQTLPLGPTHSDGSPYNCCSVYANDLRMLDLSIVVKNRWLSELPEYQAGSFDEDARYRDTVLNHAWANYDRDATAKQRLRFAQFKKKESYWLDDFALYTALRQANDYRPWTEWPEGLKCRDEHKLSEARLTLASVLEVTKFGQYLFDIQWRALRRRAREKGVLLFGDMPIYVAHDSAEVWMHPEFFSINSAGLLEEVAGVPPDYFSATGQRWGNPLYRWDVLKKHQYAWWVERLRRQLSMFDLVRIDHFRAFESYWTIPATATTAMEGKWVKAPGDDLFATFKQQLGLLPVVAEDLGYITPAVTKLRKNHGLPGMKVLQFAFDGSDDNPHLPLNYETDAVAYTGTHDNDTTIAWFKGLTPQTQRYVLSCLENSNEPMPAPMIKTLLRSAASLVILPMQDILGLGAGHRMNTPGTSSGNWHWRLGWDWLPGESAELFRDLNAETQRL